MSSRSKFILQSLCIYWSGFFVAAALQDLIILAQLDQQRQNRSTHAANRR